MFEILKPQGLFNLIRLKKKKKDLLIKEITKLMLVINMSYIISHFLQIRAIRFLF